MRSTTTGAIALAAAVVALGGCATPTEPTWTLDVRYVDLEAGTCLASSYAADNLEETDTFTVDAAYFTAVDCSQPHRAEVVGVVAIPASEQWDDYGTRGGPSIDEAADLLELTCSAYGALVDAYVESSSIDREYVVSPNYGRLSDPLLGLCIAHTEEMDTFSGDAIEIPEMLALAGGGFDADLPDGSGDWFPDPLETPVTTLWSSLNPFTCVASYTNADQKFYDVVACSLPHQAEFLGWVQMPAEWKTYRSDAEAATVVAKRCEAARVALATAPDSPVPEIVVDASTASAEFVVNERNLAQCWARLPGGEELSIDLRSILYPPDADQPAEEPAGSDQPEG